MDIPHIGHTSSPVGALTHFIFTDNYNRESQIFFIKQIKKVIPNFVSGVCLVDRIRIVNIDNIQIFR